jgi:hypothetical protein
MRNVELHAQMYSMVRNVRGLSQQLSLTSIDIPDTWPKPGEEGEWCDPKVHDKEEKPFCQITIPPAEIEYYLMERNRRHFGQAQGTTFTEAPLADLINWQADTDTAELILQGDYTNEELDDVAQLLLKHCEATTKLDSISQVLTMEDFLGKIKVWCEGTSTSPSGRHLGHYTTLAKPIIPVCEPWEKDTLEAGRIDLLQAHLNIINYCLIHGYSLKRWQRIVNVMNPNPIHKELGNNKIHRLRVIHLFEADYNLILSVKWRRKSIQRIVNSILLIPVNTAAIQAAKPHHCAYSKNSRQIFHTAPAKPSSTSITTSHHVTIASLSLSPCSSITSMAKTDTSSWSTPLLSSKPSTTSRQLSVYPRP